MKARHTDRRRFLAALAGAGAAPVIARSSASAAPVEFTDFVAGTLVELDPDVRRIVIETPDGRESISFIPTAGFYRDYDAPLSDFEIGDRVIVPGERTPVDFSGVHMSSTYEVLRGVVSRVDRGAIRVGSTVVEDRGRNKPLEGWEGVRGTPFGRIAQGDDVLVVSRFDPLTNVYVALNTGVAGG